ncbi:MAG: hypothetical protein AB7G12_17560 [Thermoanaerobaculia bacterium]
MSRIKRIRVRNVLGIEDLEVLPGRVNVIEGGNGKGKTSFSNALIAATGGGYDATLVRDGAEQAEIVFVLDDETTIQKRINRSGGGDIQVTHPDFGKIGSPATWLAGVADPTSVNPVALLTAAPKERARLILETIPMEVTQGQLEQALAGALFRGLDGIKVSGRHALEVLDEVRKRTFDERTGVNRSAKDKRRTVEELRGSVPAEATQGVPIENLLSDARGAHHDAESQLTKALATIDAEIERDIRKSTDSLHAELVRSQEVTELEVVQLREQITALQEQVTEALRRHDGARSTYKASVAEEERRIRAEAAARKESLLVERRPQVNELATTVTKLEEQLKNAAQHENTLRIMREAERDAERAEVQSDALSAAIGRLDDLRNQLVAQIPVAGVSIEDGQLKVDGHLFDRVNRARQVRVVVQAARLRAGKLPLLCVDGLECLETEAFDAFIRELESEDVQAFLTKVDPDGGPLRVRSLDAVEA